MCTFFGGVFFSFSFFVLFYLRVYLTTWLSCVVFTIQSIRYDEREWVPVCSTCVCVRARARVNQTDKFPTCSVTWSLAGWCLNPQSPPTQLRLPGLWVANDYILSHYVSGCLATQPALFASSRPWLMGDLRLLCHHVIVPQWLLTPFHPCHLVPDWLTTLSCVSHCPWLVDDFILLYHLVPDLLMTSFCRVIASLICWWLHSAVLPCLWLAVDFILRCHLVPDCLMPSFCVVTLSLIGWCIHSAVLPYGRLSDAFILLCQHVPDRWMTCSVSVCAGSASTNGEARGISVIFTDELASSCSPCRASPTPTVTAPPPTGRKTYCKRNSIHVGSNSSFRRGKGFATFCLCGLKQSAKPGVLR